MDKTSKGKQNAIPRTATASELLAVKNQIKVWKNVISLNTLAVRQ